MMRWLPPLVVLLIVLSLTACPAQPVDLGSLALELWQVPGPGGSPFLDEADEVVVEVAIDGTTTTHSLTDGVTEAIEAAPEGATVSLTLRASGPFGEAVARPSPFQVMPGGGTVVRRAVLAVPGVTVLSDTAPDPRQKAAACGDGEGAALLVGGDEGAALSFGSFLLDPADESVGEGPGLIDRRTAASCAVVGDDVWLLGGCALDGTAQPTLERSTQSGGPFAADGDPAPSSATCGTAMAPTTDGFALLAGATVQRRNADGAVLDSAALPEAHYGGTIAEHPAGGVVIAGGFTDVEQTQPVTTGRWWRPSGEVEAMPELGASALLAAGASELLAISADGRFIALTDSGTDERLAASLVTLGGGTPTAIAPSADGGAWVITDVGDTAFELTTSGATTSYPLGTARAGARLVAGPGGSTWLLGGAAGALLLQPE